MGSTSSSTRKEVVGSAPRAANSLPRTWDGRDWSDRRAGSRRKQTGKSGRLIFTEGSGSSERTGRSAEEISRRIIRHGAWSSEACISGFASSA
eukprot:9044595-Heterocapsa_arctica.AAC.1